jgi:putative transposase
VRNAESGSKSRLARELGVSRGSVYYRRKIPERDEELRRIIEAVMEANPGYGYRRVALALGINAKRAQRVMKKFHLKPARRAKTPRKPLDCGRAPESFPDILAIMSPIVPDCVWVSDFTYISFRGEFLYLATVLDLFTGTPLGFNISRNHDALFVQSAIDRAISFAGCIPEWFHSDQGSEYMSENVARWLACKGVNISTSPKSSPWRNGSQESFFGRFKTEFGDPERFESLAELIEELYLMLHYFSNVRIKTALKMAPAAFRKQWFDQREAAKQNLQSLPELPPPPAVTHRKGIVERQPISMDNCPRPKEKLCVMVV